MVSTYITRVLRRWYILPAVCGREMGFEEDPNCDVTEKSENLQYEGERGKSGWRE